MRKVVWITLVAVGLLAAACSGVGSAPEDGVEIELDGTIWTLTEINGEPPAEGGEVSLSFEMGQFAGSTGCNQYSAPYALEGSIIDVSAVTATKMACEPAALMEQEAAYFQALEQVSQVSANADRLELRSEDGSVSLFFTRQRMDPDAPTEHPAGLRESEWMLVTLNGQPVIPDSRVTLSFGETPGGWSGCNHYGVRNAEIGDGTLRFEEIESTLMACDPAEIMDQEAAYLEVLRGATVYRVEGDRLEIGTEENPAALVFERQPQYTFNPDELVGTEWQLATMDGAAPSGDQPITLRFDGIDTFSGFAGCRNYEGMYVVENGKLIFTTMGMLETECADEALLQQETAYTDHLSRANAVNLVDGRLEVYSVDGGVLVFEPGSATNR